MQPKRYLIQSGLERRLRVSWEARVPAGGVRIHARIPTRLQLAARFPFAFRWRVEEVTELAD